MDLELSDEQRELVAAVDAVCAAHYSRAVLDAAMRDRSALDAGWESAGSQQALGGGLTPALKLARGLRSHLTASSHSSHERETAAKGVIHERDFDDPRWWIRVLAVASARDGVRLAQRSELRVLMRDGAVVPMGSELPRVARITLHPGRGTPGRPRRWTGSVPASVPIPHEEAGR